ncbi:MAG: lmo0937 family membrane protein [Actinobacteria bacterium]|nr:lmo0937 family membrane protein [Actinomycetota bacterium]
MSSILWTIAIILLVLWLLGLLFDIAAGLINILLVIALALIIINLILSFLGRR